MEWQNEQRSCGILPAGGWVTQTRFVLYLVGQVLEKTATGCGLWRNETRTDASWRQIDTISDKSSWNAHLTTPCFSFKLKKKIKHPPFPPFNVDLTFRIAAAKFCSNVGNVFPFHLTTLKWGRGRLEIRHRSNSFVNDCSRISINRASR